MLRVSLLVRLAQVAFFAALIFTFYSAVTPAQKAIHLVPWDKADLAIIAALAPMLLVWWRGLGSSSQKNIDI